MNDKFSNISDRLHLSQQELFHGCQSKAADMALCELNTLVKEAMHRGIYITKKQHQRISDTRFVLNSMANGKLEDVDTALTWFTGIFELLADWGDRDHLYSFNNK